MNPSYVIAIVLVLACTLVYLLGKASNELHLEDFFLSYDKKGVARADPHKLVFIFAFVICSWVMTTLADNVSDSIYATYYAFGYMTVFTISLLSKTALVTIRDIIAIWVLKKEPTPTPGGAEEKDEMK
jgi:hypothetical protein